MVIGDLNGMGSGPFKGNLLKNVFGCAVKLNLHKAMAYVSGRLRVGLGMAMGRC